MKLGLVIFVAFWISLTEAVAQDTVFVAKHNFPKPVRNVLNAGGEIYAKVGESLYLFEEGKWEVQKHRFDKMFVFFKDSFYGSDYIPASELFDASTMKELIPQHGISQCTAAKKGSSLFVSSSGSLFEYRIYDHYSKSYPNSSIRNIFIRDSLKVVSTYSGIFINDSTKLEYPDYSNGPMVFLDSSFYLCSDGLIQFFPPDSIHIIKSATNVFAGNIRNLVKWKGNLYSLNTNSVNQLDEDFELSPIHRNEEYMAIAPVEEGLLFSTAKGQCMLWDGDSTTVIAELGIRVRHIYPVEEWVYFASDDGVYTIKNLNPATLTRVFDTKFNVHIQKDILGNTWIATENGLYISTKGDPSLIPVIESVEFNRDAFLIHEDVVYVGSIDGLYTLNLRELDKGFLQPRAKELQLASAGGKKDAWIYLSGIVAIVGFGAWYSIRKKKKQAAEGFAIPKKKEKIDLNEIEEIVVSKKISSVESLAGELDTNTVQLNRDFKKLRTTPGKYLKSVKLNHAKKLLAQGIELEEVAIQVGYSSRFLKKELGMD